MNDDQPPSPERTKPGSKPPNDLKKRTMGFALTIIHLQKQLKGSDAARVIGGQILRSGTSVGAQYREAHRARSTSEFISKVECVLQELDETMYWLELILHDQILNKDVIGPILSEADQLTAIFVTSVKTAKQRRQQEGR
jgi:four helix bundle protein